MLYSFVWLIPGHLNFMCGCYGTLFRLHTTYEDGTQYSEKSAHKIQILGNHPKERIRHSGNNESLKSSLKVIFCLCY